MKIAENLDLDPIEYANSGNSVLGIRGSGKSHTALKIAEGLLDAGIPIVVFDPSGVWRTLKEGVNGNKGYPVVIAGGQDDDIHLTKENCESIMLAAMQENVSLVVDLYTEELSSKAIWRHIVHKMVSVMMKEGKKHSLRHIFYEEAAEFVPQNPSGEYGLVYSTIERSARIGRNCHLGYTLINQRAEQVNKAILELCSLNFIHKHFGKNSILSIDKWIKALGIEVGKQVLADIPLLQPGECWLISAENNRKIKVLPRKTYHPDPKKIDVQVKKSKPADVKKFVESMRLHLKEQEQQAPDKKGKVSNAEIVAAKEEVIKYKNLYEDAKGKIKSLVVSIEQLNRSCEVLMKERERHTAFINGIKQSFDSYDLKMPESIITSVDYSYALKFGDGSFMMPPRAAAAPLPLSDELQRDFSFLAGFDYPKHKDAFQALKDSPLAQSDNKRVSSTRNEGNLPVDGFNFDMAYSKLGKCPRAIFDVLNNNFGKSFSKPQIAILTGYSVTSGSFNNAISELRVNNFIETTEDKRIIAAPGTDIVQKTGQPYNIESYAAKLGKCPRAIFLLLLSAPTSYFEKQNIANTTGYSVTSGSFNNAISELNTLELICKSRTQIRLHPDIAALVNA